MHNDDASVKRDLYTSSLTTINHNSFLTYFFALGTGALTEFLLTNYQHLINHLTFDAVSIFSSHFLGHSTCFLKSIFMLILCIIHMLTAYRSRKQKHHSTNFTLPHKPINYAKLLLITSINFTPQSIRLSIA